MDKIFTDGMIAKRNDNAPDFVICNLSFKVEDFAKFMQQHSKDGWINVKVLRSKNDKIYSELDTWEKQQGQSSGGMNQRQQQQHDSASGNGGQPANTNNEPFSSVDDDIPF